MVQKIKQAFRAKYSKVNLSNERLEAYANKWASKVEDEEKINDFLDALDIEPLEEIAKLDDALRAKGKQTEERTEKKDDEPKDDVMQKQIDELRALLESKNKSDLKQTRSQQLADLPNELKATLKFMPLEDLSDDDFTALKTDLNTQAESIKLSKSQTNPSFSQKKPDNELSADEKRYLESKQKKS